MIEGIALTAVSAVFGMLFALQLRVLYRIYLEEQRGGPERRDENERTNGRDRKGR